jgi:hypothetical protein
MHLRRGKLVQAAKKLRRQQVGVVVKTLDANARWVMGPTLL